AACWPTLRSSASARCSSCRWNSSGRTTITRWKSLPLIGAYLMTVVACGGYPIPERNRSHVKAPDKKLGISVVCPLIEPPCVEIFDPRLDGARVVSTLGLADGLQRLALPPTLAHALRDLPLVGARDAVRAPLWPSARHVNVGEQLLTSEGGELLGLQVVGRA